MGYIVSQLDQIYVDIDSIMREYIAQPNTPEIRRQIADRTDMVFKNAGYFLDIEYPQLTTYLETFALPSTLSTPYSSEFHPLSSLDTVKIKRISQYM